MTSTSRPPFRAVTAVDKPPAPEPMTRTSQVRAEGDGIGMAAPPRMCAFGSRALTAHAARDRELETPDRSESRSSAAFARSALARFVALPMHLHDGRSRQSLALFDTGAHSQTVVPDLTGFTSARPERHCSLLPLR